MDGEVTPGADGATPGPGLGEADVMTACLARLDAEAGTLQSAATTVLSDEEHGRLLADLAAARARLEAAYLHVLATFDDRPSAVPKVASGTVGAAFLVHACRFDAAAARRDVRSARQIDPDRCGVVAANADTATPTSSGLPRLGAALAAGEVSRAHLDAASACAQTIPSRLLTTVDADGWSGAARVDAFLAEQARTLTPQQLRRVGDQLLEVLDPGGRDRFDPEAHTRRAMSYAEDSTGMLVGRFALDPASGALVRAAIDALVTAGTPTPHPGLTPHGRQGELPLPDDRTPTQRRADALTDLARTYLHGHPNHDHPDNDHPDDRAPDEGTANDGADDDQARDENVPAKATAPGRRACRTPLAQVHVAATPAQIAAARAAMPLPLDAHGAPIQPPAGAHPPFDAAAPGLATDLGNRQTLTPGTFAYFLCDAVLHPTLLNDTGAALTAGRSTRLATPAQRRALITRDRGCIVPGCPAPIDWCDAHHVTYWRHGGPTDTDNLVLLCGRHHTAVHTGHWRITIRDAIPWIIPPPLIDPWQQPRRSHLPHAEHRARQLGQHLHDHQLSLNLDQTPCDGTDPPPPPGGDLG